MFNIFKKPRTPDENAQFVAAMIDNGGGVSAPAQAATLISPQAAFDDDSFMVEAMINMGMGEPLPKIKPLESKL